MSLPRKPEALPDEILGSLIVRSAANNSISVDLFLQVKGEKPPSKRAPLYDVPNKSPHTIAVLAQLGYQFRDGIRALTTRPFWECIHSIPKSLSKIGEIDEGAENPLLYRAGRLVGQEKNRTREALQICPQCVVEDYEAHHAFFVHRSHQLLGSRNCHIHRINLIARCRGCGEPLVPARPLRILRPICICGAEIESPKVAKKPSNLWTRLSKFEHECLNAPPGALWEPALKELLNKSLKRKLYKETHKSVRSLVFAAFGDDGAAWIYRSRIAPDSPIKAHLALRGATPSDATIYCAALVACGFDFKAATAEMTPLIEATLASAAHLHSGAKYRGNHDERPLTIQKAKLAIDKYLVTSPASWKGVRTNRPYAFWLLATKDHRWLLKTLGKRRGSEFTTELPLLQKDRQTITSAMPEGRFWNSRRSLVREACYRSFYRDNQWLEHAMTTSRKRRQSVEGQTLLDWLQQARMLNLTRSGRPRQFTAAIAALSIGVSIKALSTMLSRYQIEKRSQFESTNAFHRRALEWTARQMLMTHRRLFPTTLCRAARISIKPEVRALAAEVIGQLGASNLTPSSHKAVRQK